MTTKIYSSDLRELLLETTYPKTFFDQSSAILERSFNANIFLGKGVYKEFFFEGVHIVFGDIRLKNDAHLFFENDFETIEMHFALFGETITQEQESNNKISFSNNQHNIIYSNGFKGYTKWSASHQLQVFKINLLPSLFCKYLPLETTFLSDFKKGFNSGQTTKMCNQHLHISPLMLSIVQEIINCKRNGIFKRMFLEAKVIELLMLQLEQMNAFKDTNLNSIRNSDIEKMYQIKEIILNNLTISYSLTELARQVGTNEYTLKRVFKRVFGTSVFSFWNEMKMQKAKKMLAEEQLRVKEVAEKIGYKHPQHFSTAFKKHFGINPGQLKSK